MVPLGLLPHVGGAAGEDNDPGLQGLCRQRRKVSGTSILEKIKSPTQKNILLWLWLSPGTLWTSMNKLMFSGRFLKKNLPFCPNLWTNPLPFTSKVDFISTPKDKNILVLTADVSGRPVSRVREPYPGLRRGAGRYHATPPTPPQVHTIQCTLYRLWYCHHKDDF